VTSWPALADDAPYGLHHLPYGSLADREGRRFAAVRVGDHAVDLTALSKDGIYADLFAEGTLDRFLAAGPAAWSAVRSMLTDRLSTRDFAPVSGLVSGLVSGHPHSSAISLIPLSDITPMMPMTVGDYVDFYASEHHATNVGRIFRPGGDPLTPNWKHLPIGYHGRAGTVVVSGTDIRRPQGQAQLPDGTIRFGPSQKLDIEAEVGFVVGGRTELGEPIPVTRARDYLFGVCLVNDWSARDIQAWEYVPLGPFLGKSFGTSMSAWITPLAALDHAWTAPPAREPTPLPYLDDSAQPNALDIAIEIAVNGTTISRPPFASMYWTAPQLLAHMTVNGASVRPGDLLASGTVSGPDAGERGSLLELTWNGTQPIDIGTALQERALAFLEDGDEVVLTATAPAARGRISLGECRGRVQPAAPSES
jgi:fumarylacetoacetase